MDILTVLLLFLLKSFVVGGEVVNPPAGVELPKSTAEAPPEESLVIAIDDQSILIGQERVASISEVVGSPSMVIAPLDEKLETIIQQRDEIASLRGNGAQEGEIVTIQGDREIEFQVLQRVMYTLNYNGFDNISLAVLKG